MKINPISGDHTSVGFQKHSVRSSTVEVKAKNQVRTWLVRGSALVAVLALSFSSFVPVFGAANQDPKIEICHATGANNNPYNSANASETADAGGHDGHEGPVWFSGIQVSWGDIIPPFVNGAIVYPGKNWTPEGQDVYNNGACDGENE